MVGGDSVSASIAAASILAKTARDRLMEEMDGLYPGYGFAAHKGYGAPVHVEALGRWAPARSTAWAGRRCGWCWRAGPSSGGKGLRTETGQGGREVTAAPARTPVIPARPTFRDPFRLIRSLVRGREVAMVILGALVGVGSGLAVALIGTISSGLHDILFGVRGERLSGVAELPRGYWAPILGGLIIGIAGVLWSNRRPSVPVDPIEANALHGGRMSLRDSVWVTAQTLISNGFGGSVGLEAGYAQMGAGLASKLGVALRLRRNDLRILVGCGAGGAIGAAFGAPLTGAFYAFELIVGTYTVANVAPILAASAGRRPDHPRPARRQLRHHHAPGRQDQSGRLSSNHP